LTKPDKLFRAAFANFNPHAASGVDFHNNSPAPLLLIAGGKDRISPPAVVKANYKVADFALTWAASHARGQSMQAAS